MTARGDGPKYFSLLCPSFHGATMLSALLSNHSAICSAGDGNPGMRDPRRIPCKCGSKISDCEFWKGIAGLRDAAGGPWNGLWFPTTPKIIAASASANLLLAKSLAVSSFRLRRDLMKTLYPKAAQHFTDSVTRYAGYCREQHGARVFFDGEKSFAKYCSLQSCGYPIDGVIHFVRDPRAYAASSKKRLGTAAPAAGEWKSFHERLAAMATWGGRTPVLRVRYEDLVDDPSTTLNAITAFMGLDSEQLLRPPVLETLHLIGNSLAGFDGIPRKSAGWEGALSAKEIDTVVRVCSPLMQDFGYTT